LTRASLSLQNITLRTQAERLAWLADILPKLVGSGIVYTLTVRDSVLVANWLRSQGSMRRRITAAWKRRSAKRSKIGS